MNSVAKFLEVEGEVELIWGGWYDCSRFKFDVASGVQ